MKKAIIYLRVSDEMQEEKESLQKQQEQAINYCNLKGYHIYKVIKEVGSGRRKEKREGFQELEDEIEKNNFDILIFYELSRLARNQYILHSLIHSLNKNNIEFESITESYLNSDSPVSKMMLGFLASMAEIESDMTSKRVKNRMRHYASEGYWLFKPPRGYRLEDRVLYIVEEEAAVIRNIFKDFLDFSSVIELSKKYEMSYPGIKNILTNVAYIGMTKFGFAGRDSKSGKRVNNLEGEIFHGKHKAIISDKDFFLAASLLETASDNYRSNLVGNKFLLTGLLRHSCGYSASGKKGSGKYPWSHYRCRECGKTISLKDLDKLVVSEFKKYVKSLRHMKNKRKMNSSNDATIKKLKERRHKISEIYLDGIITREDFHKKINDVDVQIVKLKDQMKEKEQPRQIVNNYDKLMLLVKDFDKKDIVEKNRILKIFIDQIIYIDKESDIDIVFKV